MHDVIVIGGGHAGTEAARAAAAVLGGGARVALVTMEPGRIGQMSCNPAIGGLGKGQMVRELDALGGLMGRAIDASGIMFKMLNTSRGAAVHGPRAQADKYVYAAEVQRLLGVGDNIEIITGTIDELLVESGRAVGIRHGKTELRAGAVVLTTGTFMRGLMHTGEARTEGGRVEEGAAVGISKTLRDLGFELGRLKTGTPPRLARETIDWEALDRQVGDAAPVPFSDLTVLVDFPQREQVECRLTETTAEAHDLIRANLDRAPMYDGQIEADTGPRYCPSIEDKVVRFADRPSHHVFLEPESLTTNEVYCNGISTSLPVDVQERVVHLMPGCERAEVLRWGYAVEYDMVWPHQIDATCMTKRVDGLFFAGQINCTTGYEEAGVQGLVAGLNAARFVSDLEPFRFGREQGYLGVMMDDLVTKTPREPYRMFTSRAEHRLLLRADNADDRLTELGAELGLVGKERLARYRARHEQRERMRAELTRHVAGGKNLGDIARRPEMDVREFRAVLGDDFDDVAERDLARVIVECRYAGYLTRQTAEIRRQRDSEDRRIPSTLDPHAVPGLRTEAAEVLARFRPATMGQASRLSGINPADLTILAVALRKA